MKQKNPDESYMQMFFNLFSELPTTFRMNSKAEMRCGTSYLTQSCQGKCRTISKIFCQ